MARIYNQTTIGILKFLAGQNKPVAEENIRQECCPKISAKDFYNYIFRLCRQELAEKKGDNVVITQEGQKLVRRLVPKKDGVWKLIIFDISEKQKYVRTVLRAKLKQLHFKKWQNSIWVSPYVIDEEIEAELNNLGEKFFVRLIKTKEINHTQDLEKLF